MLAHAQSSPQAQPVQQVYALQQRQHEHTLPMRRMPWCCTHLHALLCCRVLSVYLVWSLVVQLGCTLWVVYREGGDLKQLGMHMLVLTANNTGIIGARQALQH
jgi:hypothetical protein